MRTPIYGRSYQEIKEDELMLAHSWVQQARRHLLGGRRYHEVKAELQEMLSTLDDMVLGIVDIPHDIGWRVNARLHGSSIGPYIDWRRMPTVD